MLDSQFFYKLKLIGFWSTMYIMCSFNRFDFFYQCYYTKWVILGSQNVSIFINQGTLFKAPRDCGWVRRNLPRCWGDFFNLWGILLHPFHLSSIFKNNCLPGLWLIILLPSVVSLCVTQSSWMYKHSEDCPGMLFGFFLWLIPLVPQASHICLWIS